MADQCVNCATNQLRIEDLQKELQAREKEAEALRQRLERLEKDPPWPSVESFIRHCEGSQCEHRQDWEKVKAGIVQAAYDNIPAQVLEEKAIKAGLAPTRITVQRR